MQGSNSAKANDIFSKCVIRFLNKYTYVSALNGIGIDVIWSWLVNRSCDFEHNATFADSAFIHVYSIIKIEPEINICSKVSRP